MIATEKLDALIEHALASPYFRPDADIRYQYGKMQAYKRALTSLAPFQVGDKAELTQTLEIGLDSGWYPYRDWFVIGAPVTIVDVDWLERDKGQSCFRFGVVFAADRSERTSVFTISDRLLVAPA
jgi:hypothetical protein